MTQTDYNVTNEINQYEEEIDSFEIIPEDDSGNQNEGSDDMQGQGQIEEDEESTQSQEINELRIKIRNSNGDEKELIIKYSE